MLFCVVCGRHFFGKREENTYHNEIICPFCIEKAEAEVHGEKGASKGAWSAEALLQERNSVRPPDVHH
jgi:hypothetical protein